MKITTRRLALCAVLTALALGLSTLEGMFPVSLLIPLPGIKLGLANIVTVYALYALATGIRARDSARAVYCSGRCSPGTPRRCCSR